MVAFACILFAREIERSEQRAGTSRSVQPAVKTCREHVHALFHKSSSDSQGEPEVVSGRCCKRRRENSVALAPVEGWIAYRKLKSLLCKL